MARAQRAACIAAINEREADVFVRADAGMLDVRAHPQFTDNGWIYYAYTAGTEALNTTVVERARCRCRSVELRASQSAGLDRAPADG